MSTVTKSYRRYYSGELILGGGSAIPVIFLTSDKSQIIDAKVVGVCVNTKRMTLPGMMKFDIEVED